MKINPMAQPLYQQTPSQAGVTGKFSSLIPNIAVKLNRIALLAISLFALSSLPGANAGPASYGTCVTACLTLATPVFMPACLVGCVGLAGPWCP